MEDNQLKNKNVETYTADMVKALEGGEGNIIKKIIHEEEAHEAEKKNLSPGSKKNRLFMFISILLIFLAFVVLFFLLFFNKKTNTIWLVPQVTSIVFTDTTSFKAIENLNKEKIADSFFNQANNTKVKIGGIEGVYLTENQKIVDFKKFNTLIKSNLIQDEKSNFIKDNFLLGVFKSGLSSVSTDIGEPFMLLRVSSFADVFPVMKNWESKMLYDLHGFFGIKLSSETNYLFTKSFEDGIVLNKNARILKDNDSNIVLMYVYTDDTSIIITNSIPATNEVILRLNSSQIKK